MSQQHAPAPMPEPGIRHRRLNTDRSTRTWGQALVETALVLPLILVLLLGALDFGRLFFSWVILHQAARVGANFASIDPSTTDAEIPSIIADEIAGMACEPGTPLLVYRRDGAPVDDPQLGDYAELTLSCDFSLLIPLTGILFGDPIHMQAVSSFPVRTGCIGCASGGGGEPPPPPPEQCRTVPDMNGMSVAGARNAWESAGFTGAFDAGAALATATVDDYVVHNSDTSCLESLAVFMASVTVETADAATEPEDDEVLPNLIGMTLAQARQAWTETAFIGQLLPAPTPDEEPDSVVIDQATLRGGAPVASVPGVTRLDPAGDPPIDVELQLGAEWPEPPPAPCQVPHLVDLTRFQGQTAWFSAGFHGTYEPTDGNFKIKWQSLVGGSWLDCANSITVSAASP